MAKSLYENICDSLRFSKFYESYAQSLSDILSYKYGSLLNPTDKVQDAFIKLWENCSKVTPDTAKSYVYTIANNLMLNAIKHQKVTLNYTKIGQKDYTNESPEFLMRKEQFLQQYKNVLDGLKPEQREAFLLSKVEGKTHKEIAELLGVTKKVVEHRIYGAFNTLKNKLEDFKLK
ncbi:RNA polymerase sigma-70 factor, ECF subfamily [Tenacibaculum sp. MAR_2009_124]|uniref:RNA polymerase sigma factor n=1 Tax=Tenacibaculum sp. MAR_2009_124 TaxID=1250059 RepID=UPI000896A5E6|nr:RNA polymerase sigma factor [Tenacibaculum sp. MAR_2009_124]SEB76611.1 RNA polymerase sigma-70 factor, ECF subfamily [Tenacibaculum sp. MAR_2009_124]